MWPTQNKDMNKFLKTLTDGGCKLETKGKHLKIFLPGSESLFVVVSKSPSDIRGIDNAKAKIRRAMNGIFVSNAESAVS